MMPNSRIEAARRLHLEPSVVRLKFVTLVGTLYFDCNRSAETASCLLACSS
jgi:hypothetical protein